MKILHTGYSLWNNKCPRCHEGDVFVHTNPYRLDGMFKMHKNCNHCDLKYEKEPSFFYGAMYASYAITSGWFILWFFLDKFLLHMETIAFAVFIATSIVLLSPLSMRWSRLLWLNIFNKYQKNYQTTQIQKQTT